MVSTNSRAYTFDGPGSYNKNCTQPIGTFNGGLTTNDGTAPYPRTWDTSLTGAICGQPGATVWTDTGTHNLPANANGIYCAAGTIVDPTNNLTKTVTLIANAITLSSGNTHLQAVHTKLAGRTGRYRRSRPRFLVQ